MGDVLTVDYQRLESVPMVRMTDGTFERDRSAAHWAWRPVPEKGTE